MGRRAGFAGSAAAWLLLVAGAVTARPLAPRVMPVVVDGMQLVAALALTGLALRAARRSRAAARVGWAGIAGFGASVTTASVWWPAWDLTGGGARPFPSPADAVALAGMLFALFGVAALSPRPAHPLAWLRSGVDLLVAGGALLLLAWLLLLRHGTADTYRDGLASAVGLAFLVGYAVMAGLALRAPAHPGANRRALLPLSAGLVAQAVTVAILLDLRARQSHFGAHPVDALGIAALLLMGLATLEPDAVAQPGTAETARGLDGFAPLAPLVVAATVAWFGAETGLLAPVGAIAVTALAARQSLALAEQRLVNVRERRRHLRAESVSDAVLLILADGTIPYVSPSVERFLGLRGAGLTSADLAEQIEPEDLVRLAAAFAGVLASGAPRRLRVAVRSRRGWRQVNVELSRAGDRTSPGVLVLFRDVSGQVELERSLEQASTLDPVTGLPNRTAFLRQLRAEIAREVGGTEAIVLLVDLDHFGRINESLGHSIGDLILSLAGARLAQTLPATLIARLGDDEFGILARGDTAAAERLSAAALETFREPLSAPGVELVVRASVGVARQRDGADAEAILQAADTARYAAKVEGRGRVAIYTDVMGEAVRERRALHRALPGALSREEFALWYQPLVDLRTGRIHSFEALLRWRSPEHGLVPPARFVPLAEESTLIVDIGRWVIHQASRQLVEWRTTHTAVSHVSVAVNVSGRHLAAGTLVADVGQALERSGLPSAALTVEITESVSLDDSAVPALRELRELGVRVALDDFGTGYSSLARLQRLPCDVLKLDRSFVTALGDEPDRGRRFLGSIVDMAHSLGMLTVAEGIETPAELKVLRASGVDMGQGYLFARPQPAADIPALLTAQRAQASRSLWPGMRTEPPGLA